MDAKMTLVHRQIRKKALLNISKQLEKLCLQYNYTIEELAEKSSISLTRLLKLKASKAPLDFDTMIRLAVFFGKKLTIRLE